MCQCQSEGTQPWEVSQEFGKEILRLESGDLLYHCVLGEISGGQDHRFSLRHTTGDPKEREATASVWVTYIQPRWGLSAGVTTALTGRKLRLWGLKVPSWSGPAPEFEPKRIKLIYVYFSWPYLATFLSGSLFSPLHLIKTCSSFKIPFKFNFTCYNFSQASHPKEIWTSSTAQKLMIYKSLYLAQSSTSWVILQLLSWSLCIFSLQLFFSPQIVASSLDRVHSWYFFVCLAGLRIAPCTMVLRKLRCLGSQYNYLFWIC